MICLYYFDMLLVLVENENGFMLCYIVDVFVCFGEKMIVYFVDWVKYWIVFNEYNLYFIDEVFNILGYIKGD